MSTALALFAGFVFGVLVTLGTAALASSPLRDPHDPDTEYL